jgi:hypothetical protein
MRIATVKLAALIIFSIAILIMVPFSCTGNSPGASKISAMLLIQVNLRKAQIAGPTSERLAQMQGQGMDVAVLDMQKIYIYTAVQFTPEQVSELQSLGIQVFLNSWIPPVDNHPAGFYLADMPVDKLAELAAKDFVVSLDTAETSFQPQSDVT